MELRNYQREAVAAALAALAQGRNPALQLATGTGKSLVIAAVAEHYRRAGKVVWVLTHVQQLVEQNAKVYAQFTGRADYGVVCSSLWAPHWGQLTFGSVQSVQSPMNRGGVPAPPELIIVDEAHRVPHNDPDGPSGQYVNVFKAYPGAQRLGLTATPWRMDNGLIHGEDPDRFWFDHLAYSYTVPRAVADGWLAPLVGVGTEVQLELDGVSITHDYVQSEVGQRETAEWLRAVAQSLMRLAHRRKHVAVYCPTVEAATRAHIAIAQATGWSCATLTGGHSAEERREILSAFRRQELRVLCSVDTLTTGFDLPALDCIVCLRPTLSSSLWVQIQGRGTRLSTDKRDCLILDYVGNLRRLGGVGMYDTYVREQRGVAVEVVPAQEPKQPVKRKKRQLLPGLSTLPALDPMTGAPAGNGARLTVQVHAVNAVPLTLKSSGRRALLVEYTCTTAENARISASRFLYTEKPGAQEQEFFSARRLAVRLPADPGQLVWQVRRAARPARVTVQRHGRYWNVLGEEFAGVDGALNQTKESELV